MYHAVKSIRDEMRLSDVTIMTSSFLRRGCCCFPIVTCYASRNRSIVVVGMRGGGPRGGGMRGGSGGRGGYGGRSGPQQ